MMLRELRFILIYFGCFIGSSMLLTLLIDGRPTEMLGFVLWGGLLYTATCCLTWVLINRLAAFIGSRVIRYIARFLAGFTVLSVVITFAGGGGSHANIGVLVAIQAIYILSFVLASANYNRIKVAETESD